MWQWTRDWIKLREEHPALRHGNLLDLFYDDDAYVYARQDKSETVIVILNRSADERRIKIPLSVLGAQTGEQKQLIGSRARLTMDGELTVPAKSAVAFQFK